MSDARQVRMIAPSTYQGNALDIGEEPILPKLVADRLVNRGRAVEIEAGAPAVVDAPEKPRRPGRSNRGAKAVMAAPAADPVAAVETGASVAPAGDPVAAAETGASGEPAGDPAEVLPEIGETD